MRIILNSAEVARIVVDRLLSDGRLKHSIEPVDVSWSLTSTSPTEATMIIEQVAYDNE